MKETARRVLSDGRFEVLVRAGHAAKAVVFGVVGIMAARLALGDRGETPDFAGALETMSDRPLDVLFLAVLALGLLAYAMWRFAYAFADPDNRNGSLAGWAQRAIMLGVGVTYAGFGFYAVALLLGMRRDNEGIRDETATLFTLPMGRWLVAGIAAGVVVAGLRELYVAFTARFREEFGNARLPDWERPLVLGAGWWGHAARGAIYAVAGFYGIKAAVTYDPDEARGVADTLWEIGTGPWGTWLLLFVAAGLVAFGIYSLLLAIHRHVPDADESTPEERMP